jgi:hypothetical protein
LGVAVILFHWISSGVIGIQALQAWWCWRVYSPDLVWRYSYSSSEGLRVAVILFHWISSGVIHIQALQAWRCWRVYSPDLVWRYSYSSSEGLRVLMSIFIGSRLVLFVFKP